MLPLPRPLTIAALALGLTGAWALDVPAQQSMTFRPVPPESAAALTQQARDAVHSDAERVRREARQALDEAKAVAGKTPEAPEPPALTDSAALPAPPRTPSSTTGDILRFGSDIHIPSGEVVEGDVVSFGGDVTVLGKVTGSVTCFGGDVDLLAGSRVDDDVVCLGGTLRQDPGASVGGKRVTSERTHTGRWFLPMLAMVGTGFEVMKRLVMLLFVLGIAWLFVRIAPGRTQLALDTLKSEAGLSFVLGLLIWALIIPSIIALALIIALLCITIIGIPLAAAVALAYCAFFVLAALWGSIVGYAAIGGRLHERLKGGSASLMTATVWGVIAMHALAIAAALFHIVPLFGFLGGLLKVLYVTGGCVMLTLGAGALVRSEYRRRTVQDWWSRIRPPQFPRSEAPPPGPGAMPPPPPADPGPTIAT